MDFIKNTSFTESVKPSVLLNSHSLNSNSVNSHIGIFSSFADMCGLINDRENAQLMGQLLHFCKKLPP